MVGNKYRCGVDEIQLFRKSFNQAFSAIKKADVVVLTLGLSEVWFDKQSSLYLNIAITPELVKRYPGRFEFHVFDYSKTLSYLNEIYALLDKHLKPGFRLMLTVSPVPLNVTYRSQDVLISNAYSKAVLRASVEEFIIDKANVNYFPSYEFVSLTNAEIVWSEDDFRHIHESFIDFIMANVMAQYTDAPASIYNENQYLKAKCLYYGGYLKQSKQIIKKLMSLDGEHRQELLILWTALQVGVQGKYKAKLLYLLTYFKTYKHLGFLSKIFNLMKKRALSQRRLFAGHVDVWDGRNLSGWACHLGRTSPITIKVYSGNILLDTVLAANPRVDVAAAHGDKFLNCGFDISLENKKLEGQSINVVFAETRMPLGNSPIMCQTSA
ncbi:hypothetical protein JCM14076_27180 [Methylosoma difficile]